MTAQATAQTVQFGGGEVFFNTEGVEHLEYTKMLASDEISKNSDLCLACYDGSNPLVKSAIEHKINTVNSSSMGRLFDAVAAVLDICHYNSYEGECAIALERTARKAGTAFELIPTLSPKAIIEEIKNAPKEEIALGFHHMLAKLILNISKKTQRKTGHAQRRLFQQLNTYRANL